MENRRFTHEEIIEMLNNKYLGTIDGTPINGILASFMSGAAGAIYNLATDETDDRLAYSITHMDDPDPDYWEIGYYAVISHYARLKSKQDPIGGEGK